MCFNQRSSFKKEFNFYVLAHCVLKVYSSTEVQSSAPIVNTVSSFCWFCCVWPKAFFCPATIITLKYNLFYLEMFDMRAGINRIWDHFNGISTYFPTGKGQCSCILQSELNCCRSVALGCTFVTLMLGQFKITFECPNQCIALPWWANFIFIFCPCLCNL